jgi:hypothetical protein
MYNYLQIRIQIFAFVAGTLVEESDGRSFFVIEARHAETAREAAAGVHHQRHLRFPQPCNSGKAGGYKEMSSILADQ